MAQHTNSAASFSSCRTESALIVDQTWRAALVISSLIALGANWYYFQGFIGSDDNRYLMAAYRLITGDILANPSSLVTDGGAPRLGLVGFVAIVLYLTGNRLLIVSMCFVAFHLIMVLQAAWLGSKLYGRECGLWASILMAISPLICYFSGVVLPDPPMAILTNFALMLLLQANGETEHTRRIHWKWPFGAGLLIALSASTNIIGLIMVVPAMATIYLRQRDSGLAGQLISQCSFWGGFLLIVALFYLGMLLLTGHAFSEMTLISKWTGGDFPHGFWPWERVAYIYRLAMRLMPLSVWAYLALAAAYLAIPNRNAILLIWVCWPILYLTFGSVRFDLYVPPPLAPRHYLVAAVPGAVIGARVLWYGISYAAQKIAPSYKQVPWVILAVVVSASSVHEMYSNKTWANNYEKRSVVNAFLEAHYLARNQYPDLPVVLSSELSDRVSALFVRDKRPDLYINNVTFNGFKDGLPCTPFLFMTWSHPDKLMESKAYLPLAESDLQKSRRVSLIAPPYIYSYELWQGSLFSRFNPSTPFIPRSTISPVCVFLVAS